jgi:protein-S-isoprenylcysteine O-methyltransferase Ste14
MISLAVTESLRKRFPNNFRFYRIFFNIFSIATLLPVIYYTYSLRGETLIDWDGSWRIVPIFLGVAAIYFFVAGSRRYDFLQFSGIRQISDEKTCSVITDDCSLDTGGVLSIVRHPWYSGGILIIWARPMDLAAIITNLVLSGYFVIGTMLEERKLKVQFGKQYTDYQQRVSMLFPIKWAGRLITGKK